MSRRLLYALLGLSAALVAAGTGLVYLPAGVICAGVELAALVLFVAPVKE